MDFLLYLIIGIVLTAGLGYAAHIVSIMVPLPDKIRQKFFQLVPLYPKRKYQFIVYPVAGLLYATMVLVYVPGIIAVFIALILASQIARLIAKRRNEDLEETYEEELERKRKMAP